MGSIRHDLHIIALNIFNLRAANNIDVDIQWIPRNKLEKADFISRIIDIDIPTVYSVFLIILGVCIQWIIFLINIIASCLGFSLAIGIQDARK